MGIIQRFKDIMSANVNAVLDKAEDPAKMVDQYLRNLQDDYGKVKAETAAVMAEEKRAKRELNECEQQISKMQTYAEKALIAGNEQDARTFLTKKASLEDKKNTLAQSYDIAKTNADKMRQMHDKLAADIKSLEERKANIKAKMAMAKAKERTAKMGSSITGAGNAMAAFDRMEAKANQMLDQADAMAELNGAGNSDDIEDLMSKYDTPSCASSAVDDDLAALKAKLGL
ncbi:MAG: PspA/IM30 family protein [Lachnospiraceae bacterium]